MKLYTWSEIKTIVEREYNLEGETFITPNELQEYCNKGIDRAEQIICNLYEDYFLTYSDLSLVKDQDNYSLPSDCYAHKIVALWFKDGSTEYEIRKLRRRGRHRELSSISGQAYYYYRILWDSGGSPKIRIYPTPNKTVTVTDGIEYIRNANRISSDSDTIDMPEAANFLIQYIKDQCVKKEKGTPDAGASDALLQEEKRLIDTLTDMTPDEDNEILLDTSFYEDFYLDESEVV